jgi:hypothetical protein
MKPKLSSLVCVVALASNLYAADRLRLGDYRPVKGDRAETARFKRLDSDLARIVLSDDPVSKARKMGLVVRDGLIGVEVVVDPSTAEQMSRWLREGGAADVAGHGGVIGADVSVALLAALEQNPLVSWVRRPAVFAIPEPWLRGVAERPKSGITTEAIDTINAGAWHADGFTGQGIKVGVIDIEFFGWQTLVGDELPGPGMVHFQSFGAPASSAGEVHGTAVAEIIHDLAPDAELYLAHMGNSGNDFINAVQWFISNGVRAVAMSVTVFGTSPGDGTGTLQSWVDTFVQQADGVWAHSAGNYRQAHWQGRAVDSDGNGWVELYPGEEIAPLSFTIDAGENLTFSLGWNDWAAVNQDYSLHLFRIDGAEPVEVASADSLQTGGGGQRPTEWLDFTVSQSGRYGLGIFRKSVSQVNDLNLVSASQWPLTEPVNEGSLVAPADAPGAMATAASGWSGLHTVRTYSSAGPAKGAGGSLDGGVIKPDITGYDGVSTASYGPTGFPGTSAAAPHVAGAAAIVMSANPGWSGAQVRSFLESGAIDKGPPGMDIDYGAGRLTLGNPPSAACSFSLDRDRFDLGAHSGGGIVNVTADEGCFWSSESQASWIVAATDSGIGSGRAIFTVEANDGPSPREGTLLIAGVVVTVAQQASGCDFVISPSAASYTAQGGQGEIEISTGAQCSWTASSLVDWVEITGGASGTGNGTVNYQVDANPSDAARQGELRVAGQTFTVNQAGVTQGGRWLVAGIAEISGAAGTNWKSSLAVCNRSGAAADFTMTYRRGDGESEIALSLPDGNVVEFDNVAADLFGVPDSSGAVELTSDLPLVITARTFNDVAGGTFGQFLPGVEPAEAITGGQVGVLSQLRSDGDFRTNIGFISFAADSELVRIRLFDGAGTQIGTELSESVPGGGWSQVNRVFREANAGNCGGCYALVDLVGGVGGPLWAYASVVDNSSGDPTTIPMEIRATARQKANGEYLVAGIAQTSGAAGTNWKSNVAALNVSGSAAHATLEYRHDGGVVPVAFELADGELIEWENLAELLGAPDSAGAAAISSDVPLVVTARTFNDVPGGTFGQFLPGLGADAALGPTVPGVLSQIKRTGEFRTNIGFTNYGDSPCDARIRLFGADGERQGSDVLVENIPPGGWKQQNRVFQAAGVSSCPIGYATIDVLTAGCEVWAYASVVDNGSGDPTTIPVAAP